MKDFNRSIDKTQIKLKQNLDKDEYDAIQNTIQINQKATKKTLQQRELKKYNCLKRNPKPAVKATDFQEVNENWVQPSYAQVTARVPLKKASLTNTNSKPYNKNIHEKTTIPCNDSSPCNRFCKQSISPSRKPSQTNRRKNEEYEKEITKLKEEIKTLKLSNRQKTATKNSFSSKQNTDSRNVNMSSTTSGDENEILHARHYDHFIKL